MRAWSRATGCLAFLILSCGQRKLHWEDVASESAGGDPSTGGKFDARTNAGGGGKASGGDTSGANASGGNADAGNASAGNTSAGMAGSGGTATVPQIAACDALAAAGVFEDITPPEVKAGIGMDTPDNQTKGGPFAMAVDPINLGTLYSGTAFQGIWKSADCGTTWKKVATGTNAANVNDGVNWTLGIDPQDPKILYTNSGNQSNGLFKSVDGGANWTDIWSKKSQPELGKAFANDFANAVAIDPSDHLHLLLTFKQICLAPHTPTCIAESMNGGTTWRLIDGKPTWNGTEGQVLFFLDNSSTWLWGSQTNGFWRSSNRGESWDVIPNMTTSNLQGSQLARVKGGAFFAAGADGIWTSPDGSAPTWKLIPDTGPIVGGLVSNGTNIYASTCYFAGFCNPRYLHSAETNGKTWTALPNSPTLKQGGTLGYDTTHQLLYSSNLDAGLWRVVVP